MLRSMLSAASALKNHQTYMDVVANNIANVNTTGYKTARATFQETLSQMMTPGSSPTAARGGINPIQIGLGMSVGSVDTIFTQGATQATGNSSDLALDGTGFFILQDGTQDLYSRDGSMSVNVDGSMTNTATGLRVMGWNANAAGTVDTAGALQTILIPLNQGIAQATGTVTLNGSLNSELANRSVTGTTVTNTVDAFGTAALATGQTELTSGEYYIQIAGTTAGSQTYQVVDSSGNAVSISNGAGGFTTAPQTITGAGTINTGRGLTFTIGAGDGATPPLYTTGTRGSGAAVANYVSQSVTQDIQVYDSLGAAHTLTLNYTKSATTNQWTWQVTEKDAAMTVSPTTASIVNFTTDGQYATTNPAASLTLSFTNGAANQTVKLDMTGLTQLAQTTNMEAPTQDGYGPGTLTSYDVGTDGKVTGIYSNGLRRTVAQLAVATFENPSGLLRSGDNMYAQWTNSGVANVGVAGVNGRGSIKAGYLEGANVDLAQQFTNLITAQRGFQANSRVVTASDQMLQDLVNLVR